MPERNLRFLINCGAGKRGVYLREARDVNKPSEVVITIEPMYLDNDSTSKLFLCVLDGSQVGSLGETSPMISDADKCFTRMYQHFYFFPPNYSLNV